MASSAFPSLPPSSREISHGKCTNKRWFIYCTQRSIVLLDLDVTMSYDKEFCTFFFLQLFHAWFWYFLASYFHVSHILFSCMRLWHVTRMLFACMFLWHVNYMLFNWMLLWHITHMLFSSIFPWHVTHIHAFFLTLAFNSHAFFGPVAMACNSHAFFLHVTRLYM